MVALFRGQAAAKRLALRLHCPEPIPLALADRNRIRQALINLVSNAVKFTEQGSVAISLARHDLQFVRIEIADTGIGIPGDRLDRLFQPFSQVESGLTRRYGGAGLGLIISQRLVEGMGGKLGVTTEEQVGSTFTILLPIAPAGSVQHTSAMITRNGQAPLLVADSCPVARRVTSLLLQQLGLECVLVEDGKTALETWRQGEFSAVLLKRHLRELDGVAVTRAIRAAELTSRLARIPVIGLFDDEEPADREACLVAGMDENLTTPLTVERLRHALALWLLIKDGITQDNPAH